MIITGGKSSVDCDALLMSVGICSHSTCPCFAHVTHISADCADSDFWPPAPGKSEEISRKRRRIFKDTTENPTAKAKVASEAKRAAIDGKREAFGGQMPPICRRPHHHRQQQATAIASVERLQLEAATVGLSVDLQ